MSAAPLPSARDDTDGVMEKGWSSRSGHSYTPYSKENLMDIKNDVVAGGGVLGSQIAYQSAYKGFNVTIWLRSEGSIDRCQPKLDRLHAVYLQTLEAAKTNPTAWANGFADERPDAAGIDQLKERAEQAAEQQQPDHDDRRVDPNRLADQIRIDDRVAELEHDEIKHRHLDRRLGGNCRGEQHGEHGY